MNEIVIGVQLPDQRLFADPDDFPDGATERHEPSVASGGQPVRSEPSLLHVVVDEVLGQGLVHLGAVFLAGN